MTPEKEKQCAAIRADANKVAKSLWHFKKVCDKEGHPLRTVTFRMFDNGKGRLRFAYKGKTKCPKTKT